MIRYTLITTLIAFPITGYGAPAALTYDQFEIAVPHVDLENCPAALAGKDRFCRATLRNEEIHVFAFADSNESPMIGFKSYGAQVLETLLK